MNCSGINRGHNGKMFAEEFGTVKECDKRAEIEVC